MTSNRVTYASVLTTIDHPIEKVWAPIAQFGGLDRWAAGVTACTVEGEGPGAVRTVTLGNRSVRERMEEIDNAAYRLRYHILEPHSMPAHNVYGEIILTQVGVLQTKITWRSEASDFEVPIEQIRKGIETFYTNSIGRLSDILGAGSRLSF